MSPSDVIIFGITRNGKAFRPSDWAERLCGVVGVFDPPQRAAYQRLVRQVTVEGAKCVYVSRTLEHLEPRFFKFLLDFAHDNELRTAPPPLAMLRAPDPAADSQA